MSVAQLRAPMFGIAPKPAAAPADIVVDLVPSGGSLVLAGQGDMDPGRLREIQAAQVKDDQARKDRSEGSGVVNQRVQQRWDRAAQQWVKRKLSRDELEAQQVAQFRETLLAMADQNHTPTLAIAGTLLRSHGDMARTRHARGIEGEWSPTEVRVDALLSMAGVPAAVQLGLAK